jgi:hypothetical protein
MRKMLFFIVVVYLSSCSLSNQEVVLQGEKREEVIVAPADGGLNIPADNGPDM